MSTPLKIVILLVAWFVYSLLAYQGCVKQCCPEPGLADDGTAGQTDTLPPGDARFPLSFQWDNMEPVTGEGWEALRNRLIKEMGEGRILEIMGFYYESEAKPKDFDNMGFARADRVRALLAGAIPADRMKLRARALDDDPDKRTGYFEAADFSWTDPEPVATPETEETEIEELADRIIIRFPYNSDRKLADPAIDEYLDKLASRLKQTSETVRLTGHTDNKGNDGFNQNLGMKRANAIRDLLVEKGVQAARITTDSKGESQPEDRNETEAGRQNNRRVEVRLVKQ
jgi:OmpA-OmpF porin, OOP family